MLAFDIYRVKLVMLQPLLGTMAKSKDVYSKHMVAKLDREKEIEERAARKDPNYTASLADGTALTDESLAAKVDEELADTPESDEKGCTGFLTDQDGRYISSHMIKGMLKHAGSVFKERGNLKMLASKIQKYVSVYPAKIRLSAVPPPESYSGRYEMIIPSPDGPVCERSIRVVTKQGPRVALVQSDVVLEGEELDFNIRVLAGGGVTKKLIAELLEYGEYFEGLGQWRSSGIYGQFRVASIVRVDMNGKQLDDRVEPEPTEEGAESAPAKPTKAKPRKAAAAAAE